MHEFTVPEIERNRKEIEQKFRIISVKRLERNSQ